MYSVVALHQRVRYLSADVLVERQRLFLLLSRKFQSFCHDGRFIDKYSSSSWRYIPWAISLYQDRIWPFPDLPGRGWALSP